MGADDNPEETKMDHLPDDVLKDIAAEKGSEDQEEKLEEDLLDEEEVDETVRAYASRNAPHFTEREQHRIRESIYNKFKKLIK